MCLVQFLLYMHARSNLIFSIDQYRLLHACYRLAHPFELKLFRSENVSKLNIRMVEYKYNIMVKTKIYIIYWSSPDLIDTVLKLIFFLHSDSIMFNENNTSTKILLQSIPSFVYLLVKLHYITDITYRKLILKKIWDHNEWHHVHDKSLYVTVLDLASCGSPMATKISVWRLKIYV